MGWVEDSMKGLVRKKERFSKTMLTRLLAQKIRWIQFENQFDPDNGWAQVDGKGEEINREYGEYIALRNLADQLDIAPEMYAEIARLNREKPL